MHSEVFATLKISWNNINKIGMYIFFIYFSSHIKRYIYLKDDLKYIGSQTKIEIENKISKNHVYIHRKTCSKNLQKKLPKYISKLNYNTKLKFSIVSSPIIIL